MGVYYLTSEIHRYICFNLDILQFVTMFEMLVIMIGKKGKKMNDDLLLTCPIHIPADHPLMSGT